MYSFVMSHREETSESWFRGSEDDLVQYAGGAFLMKKYTQDLPEEEVLMSKTIIKYISNFARFG